MLEMYPDNWPSDIRYLTKIDWIDATAERAKQFKEELGCSEYVSVCSIKNADSMVLLSKSEFPEGAWLDEITGQVVQGPKDETNKFPNYYIKFDSDEKSNYYIDVKESGNEMRFIRRTTDERIANVRFSRLLFNGRLGIFVEVIKDIAQNSEIIGLIEDEKHESGFFGLTKADSKYRKTKHLIWSGIDSEVKDALTSKYQNLSSLVQIRTIQDDKHPCKGEFGVYAKQRIIAGDYIGEYTGKVLFADGTYNPHNRYLADFTPNENLEAGMDASNCGNETRFINDFHGIGNQNAKFRLLWISGELHLFVQAYDDIEPGDEILVNYGVDYWNQLQQ